MSVDLTVSVNSILYVADTDRLEITSTSINQA
jgi:hypothetical protein